MEEEWKNYIHTYSISNIGNIRNDKTGKILKQTKNQNGYLKCCVSLGKRKELKSIRMNRAVAICFIPNPDDKEEVNHINGIKTDNRVENLEWMTAKENTKHAFDNGLRI